MWVFPLIFDKHGEEKETNPLRHFFLFFAIAQEG